MRITWWVLLPQFRIMETEAKRLWFHICSECTADKWQKMAICPRARVQHCPPLWERENSHSGLHDEYMMKKHISMNPVNKITALSAQEGDLALRAHWDWERNKLETQTLSQQTWHSCKCSSLALTPFPSHIFMA